MAIAMIKWSYSKKKLSWGLGYMIIKYLSNHPIKPSTVVEVVFQIKISQHFQESYKHQKYMH